MLAPVLRRALGIASRPLHGRVVSIAHGPAKGLLLAFDETSAVWVSGRTELPVQHALERLVEPGAVFFDIGANVGFFTLLGARLVGPSGTVVAFEPHPENIEKLRQNVDLNSLSTVVVVPKGVSEATGDRILDARHTATASLVESDGDVDGFVSVENTSLDDFLRARPDLKPDVVKIDAEGHEVEIVHGMQETFHGAQPILICEMHGRDREFADAIEAVGYLTAGVSGDTSSTHVIAAPAGHRALVRALSARTVSSVQERER